jgi:hypothetical protein
MSENMTVEQSDGSQAARPWRVGNALKNAAGGVLGLVSIQAVVYAASVGAQVVQSLAHGAPLDVGLWAPNATIMACVGVVASLNLLSRKEAPSNERFAQGWRARRARPPAD